MGRVKQNVEIIFMKTLILSIAKVVLSTVLIVTVLLTAQIVKQIPMSFCMRHLIVSNALCPNSILKIMGLVNQNVV